MENEVNQFECAAVNVDREDINCSEFQALIFCFDVLLVDTKTHMFRVWEALKKPYGVDVSPRQVAGLILNLAPATFLHSLST
ncbi:HAD family hydrolase [Aeromonas allosaccharophila]|uniref:hypothetical protein n=1 Tax=Aeromonas allosaccharophila TaxID=656 RepID=UPI002ADFCFF4|nr:hypothetical protein [Aeromonas allosaccharophila]